MFSISKWEESTTVFLKDADFFGVFAILHFQKWHLFCEWLKTLEAEFVKEIKLCFWAFYSLLPSDDICLVGPFSPRRCQGKSFSVSCPHFWQVWNDVPVASVLKVSFSALLPCIRSSFPLSTQTIVPSRSINEYNASHLYCVCLGETQSILLSLLFRAAYFLPEHQQMKV